LDILGIMTTPDAPNTPPQLPTVRLEDLTPTAKDYLLSLHAATGKPVAELIRDILQGVAALSNGRAA
jgi:hypothetical protein